MGLTLPGLTPLGSRLLGSPAHREGATALSSPSTKGSPTRCEGNGFLSAAFLHVKGLPLRRTVLIRAIESRRCMCDTGAVADHHLVVNFTNMTTAYVMAQLTSKVDALRAGYDAVVFMFPLVPALKTAKAFEHHAGLCHTAAFPHRCLCPNPGTAHRMPHTHTCRSVVSLSHTHIQPLTHDTCGGGSASGAAEPVASGAGGRDGRGGAGPAVRRAAGHLQDRLALRYLLPRDCRHRSVCLLPLAPTALIVFAACAAAAAAPVCSDVWIFLFKRTHSRATILGPQPYDPAKL